ncbi:MAG: 50S ribosomal protein L11 methyltransferase [Candidatus Sumerlaeia bacterium]|nr:50S ribosomal protein L11 methyltransferase [Candidatus Sumerlaeia bacterium]
MVFANRLDGAVAAESLASVLDDLGASGWQEATPDVSDEVLVRVFFPNSIPPSRVHTRVVETARGLQREGIFSTLPQLKVTAVEQHDWVGECRRGFRGVRVSRRLRVVPPWRVGIGRQSAAARPIEIVILPGMAFGTGLHETTRLCLRLMEKEMRGGERAADIGAGSGILSIAAIKLGARSVQAVELDAQAYENFRENLRLNRVGNRIRLFAGGLQDFIERRSLQHGFDLIVCNILFEKICPLLPYFRALVRRPTGATVILSGYLWTDRDNVMRHLESAGICRRAQKRLGDWGAVVGRLEP